MTPAPSATFPSILRPAWARTDASTRCDRLCDALQKPTAHQMLSTRCGSYWVCSVTGQLSRDEQLEDVQDFYDESWEYALTHRPESRNQAKEHAKWLARMEPYRRGGRLYEVGAGSGTFLRDAARANWRAEGSDISEIAVAHAAKVSGAKVQLGAIEHIDLEPDCYDVILCNNVFEHLEQPHDVLCKLAAALRQGGVIFFQTLSAQSLSLWFQPTGWLYYGRGHLYIPTLVSLAHYFNHASLVPVHFETHGFHSSNTDQGRQSRKQRRLFDKLMATVAGRLHRGHRVKYLLEKSDRDY